MDELDPPLPSPLPPTIHPSSTMSADEDLDDLDDILDDFTPKPKPTPPATAPAAPSPGPSAKTTAQPTAQPSDDDLSRQMAALLSSLGSPSGDGDEGEGDDLTRLLAQIMRADPGEEDQMGEGEGQGEGEMDDAGFEELLASLGQPPIRGPSTAQTAKKPTPTDTQAEPPLSFEETIKRTMSNLKTSSSSAAPPQPDTSDPLAQLLASLNIDPSDLDLDLASLGLDPSSSSSGTGTAAGTGDFSGVLDGMMKQLMTKEILEEPLAELAEKYPGYLSTPAAAQLPVVQRDKYTQQSAIVSEILEIFGDERYSDADDVQRGRVTVLMTRVRLLYHGVNAPDADYRV